MARRTRKIKRRKEGGERKGHKGKPAAAGKGRERSRGRDGKGGGASPDGRQGSKDREGKRARPQRPSASPAPFIAMGALILVLIVVAVAVSRHKAQPPVTQTPVTTPAATPPPASPPAVRAPAAAAPPAARAPVTAPPRAPAPPPRAVRKAKVRIGVEGRGFSQDGREQRSLKASCGSCGEQLTGRATECPNCRAILAWVNEMDCPFCCSGKPGLCAYCKGTGKDPNYSMAADRLPFGMSRSGRTEECPACRGGGQCSWCGRTAKIDPGAKLRGW